jgi:hypothetical protein
MDSLTLFPDREIAESGPVSRTFLGLGVRTFREACRYVHALPYGYNTDRDDPMVLFEERMGTCTTKHAAIAALAAEIGLPVAKRIGIYAMTEAVVTGTEEILARYDLPYVPMPHCFLEDGRHRVDLTEGNRNGKNRPIDDFLFTAPVAADLSAREEYLIYRKALKDVVLKREELAGADIRRILHAREEGLKLLKANLQGP